MSKFEKISRRIAYIIAWINIIIGWVGGIFTGIFTMFVGLMIILSLNGKLELNKKMGRTNEMDN